MKHIAFTGGGSGWHITPIAALIEYGLQDTHIASQCKLFRFWERDALEERSAKSYDEVTFVPVRCGKLRRYFSFQAVRLNLRDAFWWIVGIFETAYLLRKHRIDFVFCKWGHVALPVCIAAYLMRVPIAMHESDTYAGMTNRLVAKMTPHRFVWFPDILAPSICIWQLLSPRLLHPDETFFDTSAISKPIVLVMWGSQWAWVLFDRLLRYLTTEHSDQFHFLVLLWSKNGHYTERFASYSNVHSFTFIEKPEHMARLYQVADIAITRGSATSLAEQQLYTLCKIIVPLPYTWWNHQWYNGLRYRDTYGDRLFEQNDRLEEQLTTTLDTMISYHKTTQEAKTVSLATPLHIVRHTLLQD